MMKKKGVDIEFYVAICFSGKFTSIFSRVRMHDQATKSVWVIGDVFLCEKG